LLQFHWWDYNDASYLDALDHLSKLQSENKIKHLESQTLILNEYKLWLSKVTK
jgi:aryl-alcohol dehydrogenase-like predicted oxidoreductase